MPTVGRNRVCTCAQATGHQQRYSKFHISHSSIYKTIEEEMLNTSSPAKSLLLKKISPTTHQPVFIVDSDTVSIHLKLEESTWDDECGITTLRKYYALRDEAENVVVESKHTWLNTLFSLFEFTLQSSCLFSFYCLFTNSFYQHSRSKHLEVQLGCRHF